MGVAATDAHAAVVIDETDITTIPLPESDNEEEITDAAQTNYSEILQKIEAMQDTIDMLNTNMATQNHNHTQELIKCRNESAQKDLQIKGLQENIYSLLHSLNLRVVNIETVLRQQHQHPGHTPSTQHTPPQHVIATPTQHVAAPTSTQYAVAPPGRGDPETPWLAVFLPPQK